MYLNKILIQHPIYDIDNEFYYASDVELIRYTRVLVDFNRQKDICGFVIDPNFINGSIEEIQKKLGFPVKFINKIIDNKPLISEYIFNLCKYFSNRYFYPLIGVLQTALPPSLKPKDNNLCKISVKYEEFYELNNNLLENVNLTKNELNIVKKFDGKLKVSKRDLNKTKALASLIERNIITLKKVEISRYFLKKSFNYEDKISLSSKQNDIYERILNSEKNVFLLKGVTGSGKTEIYLKLIEKCLNENKNIIILVPEIGLTPLMISRVISYFNDVSIAILHSGLTNSERYDEYRKISDNKVRIVIGTRSAIFAPLTNLGLIIIDEEHDDSYKQESMFLYDAKEIALYRSKYENTKLILGSATPSIESMSKALANKYELLEINERYGESTLPEIRIVDRCDVNLFSISDVFSIELINEMKKCLLNNEQIILLINQKGYSRSLYCRECGYTFKCPKCGLPLFYHLNDNSLRCHRCEFHMKKPLKCPECASHYLGFNGFGIEKVEEEFKKIFPSEKYLLLDGDTIKNDSMIASVLEQFDQKQASVLIGTSMVAKGHDFKNVTLVGIINADTLLNYPSIRSNEKTFDLLTQCIGRCGRGKSRGIALIQTVEKDNQVIKFIKNNDYDSFFNYELDNRKILNYPPFVSLLDIVLSSNDYKNLYVFADEIKKQMINSLKNIQVLGPSNLRKENKKFILKLTIKVKKYKDVVEPIRSLIEYYKINKKFNLKIDLNPKD